MFDFFLLRSRSPKPPEDRLHQAEIWWAHCSAPFIKLVLYIYINISSLIVVSDSQKCQLYLSARLKIVHINSCSCSLICRNSFASASRRFSWPTERAVRVFHAALGLLGVLAECLIAIHIPG